MFRRLSPFRAWCQTVLPTVYTDALSYQELLGHVIKYLNTIVVNVNDLDDRVVATIKRLNELKKYVDHYFDTLDISQEVREKLDDMAASGELGALLLAITGEPINTILVGRNYVPPMGWDYDTDLYQLNYADYIRMWDDLRNHPAAAGRLEKVISQYYSYNPTSQEVAERSLPGQMAPEPLVYYRWKPRNIGIASPANVENYESSSETTPGFIITGAIHGNEKQGSFAFYQLFKDWLNGGSYGRYMLDNFHFVLIPVANPYGWNFNTRNNGRAVNINRNFEYGWESYAAPAWGSNGKGSAAYSEPEAQFLKSIIDAYSATKYRSSMIMLDLHGFHVDLHMDDNRKLWFVSNDYDLKRGSLRLISYLKLKITEKFPEEDNGNPFATWSSQGSTPDFDNECREHGLRPLVVEVPQRFGGSAATEAETEYSEKTAWISYLIVPNVLLNISDLCYDNWQNKHFQRSFQIGAITGRYSLMDLANKLPSGSSITLSIGSKSDLQSFLPSYDEDEHAGILDVQNNGGVSRSPAAVFTWTITSTNHCYQWIKTVSSSGVEHPWTRADAANYSLFDIVNRINALGGNVDEATLSLEDIFATLPVDCSCTIYINNVQTPKLYSDVGSRLGYLTVYNPHSNVVRKLATFTGSAAGETKVWRYDGNSVTQTADNRPNTTFAFLKAASFPEIVASMPGSSRVSGYIAASSTLGANAPNENNGFYTLEICDTGSSKYGRLTYTSTSSNHKMYYTRVTETAMDPWTEV